MRYVISTHTLLTVIDFNAEWEIENHCMLGSGYHYGIALLHESNVSLKPSHFVVYRGGVSNRNMDANELLRYENINCPDLLEKIKLSEEFSDVHQLAQANDGLYFVNTGCNSLVFQSNDQQTRHEHFFNNLSYDLNHPNSIYPCGNQLLVMLHNRRKKESELAILEHDLSTGFSLVKTLSLWNLSSHNVFVDGQYLFYNGSDEGDFVVVDLQTGQVIKKLTLQGHTKGISVTQDFIVVGLTEHSFRDRRFKAKSQLAIIDRHSLSLIKIVDLSLPSLLNSLSNINEIRCLSEKELAHASVQQAVQNWQDIDFQVGVAWPKSRFTDHGDGTVIDNLTGLIWLQNANSSQKKRDWQSALADVMELNTNGTMNGHYAGDKSNAGSCQVDWRLPTVREVLSLVDYGQHNPALPLDHLFHDIQLDIYWTGSMYSHQPSQAWYIHLNRGYINDDNKAELHYVLPVRGRQSSIFQPDPRFTDNGDGTVTDNLTGLVWLQNANSSQTKQNWQSALDDVLELNTKGTMNGYHAGDRSNNGSHQVDWRLPNVSELISLIDYERYEPALSLEHPFHGVQLDYYWSGSTYSEVITDAWGLNLEYGNVNDGNKLNRCYVWPVR